ncbi:MAG: adenosylmethionine--8-amino-7-oxononanoate transaminase [Azospirillum brasilense]|nr:MAG: adenosylmethionine--8-amino-7-oxononanoate transaminase [Azospirillum brasilense]
MNNTDWFDQGYPHIWLPYAQMQTVAPPVPVLGAAGSRLQLADGRELVDGISSWWSTCHGYQHPHIVEAIQKQAGTLSHVMFAGLAHAQPYQLAQRLCAFTRMGMERVFFAESGSVAVEVAMKMALQYWRNKGEPKRTKFIYFTHGYHGDTMGAMGVSSDSDFKGAFSSLTLKNYQLDIPHDEYSFAEFADTVAAIRGQVAALIMEPLVQGAGGMKFHSADILSEIRRVCREQDILFIADEIATGFGRTGNLFACHEAAIEPDILCLGKALTGGHMPLAATLAKAHVFDAFLGDSHERALMHGPTYMAHAIGCAAANASLDLFEREPRLAQAEALEQKLWDGLKHLAQRPAVRDVRVKGAIGVVEMECSREDVQRMRTEALTHGVWLRPFGNILYVTPPLNISDADLDVLLKAMDRLV